MSPTSLLGFTRAKTIAGFAIREFWQPPYRRLPWHEHQEASICYVVAGSYMERVRGLDRQCSRYTMVFKPPRERHADQFGDLGGTCLLIEIDAGRLKDIEPFSDITKNPSVVQNAKLATLGHDIYREFSGGDHFSPLAIEGLILEVLAETSRAGRLDATSDLPRWLRQARENGTRRLLRTAHAVIGCPSCRRPPVSSRANIQTALSPVDWSVRSSPPNRARIPRNRRHQCSTIGDRPQDWLLRPEPFLESIQAAYGHDPHAIPLRYRRAQVSYKFAPGILELHSHSA